VCEVYTFVCEPDLAHCSNRLSQGNLFGGVLGCQISHAFTVSKWLITQLQSELETDGNVQLDRSKSLLRSVGLTMNGQ
jgi:hypothetical protein